MLPSDAAHAEGASVGLRLRIALILTLWFFLVYGVSDHVTASRLDLVSVSLPFDRQIPFLPDFAIVYLSISALLYLPLLLLHDANRLTALALAFAVEIGLAGAIFLALPFEPSVHPAGDHGRVFTLIDRLNLDHNGLPSLHVALATTAAWSVSRALLPGWRVLLWIWAGLVVLSTLLTKQHFLADVAAGLGLAALTIFALLPACERLFSGRS